jgi:hypothetical protein
MITTEKVLDPIQKGHVGICEGCNESLEPELPSDGNDCQILSRTNSLMPTAYCLQST